MSGETPLSYATLVEKPEQFGAGPVAQALAAWKRVPAADMIVPARRCWGIAAQGESKERAEDLASVLRRGGVESVVVPDNLLEELPPVSTIPALEPSAAKRLALLAVAAFKITTSREVKTVEGPSTAQRAVKIGLLMAGIPTLGGGAREVIKKVEESDLHFYADLVLESPVERLRVDAQAFDFSCLGARKAYGALVNFRTLLEWLSDLAPKAARNRGCRFMLDGKPVREMGYESLDDLEREEKWLLTLRALGKL